MDPLNTTSEILELAEARRRLVAVRPIVLEIMETSRCLAAARDVFTEAGATDAARNEAAGQAERAQERLRTLVGRLNAQGAVLKDPAVGLIDFYSWKDDEVVLLCWLYGEPTIGYWHGMREGFRGRKPVTDGLP